jgi:glycosyltransferase involved in cell wall biosynthesis
MKVLFLAPLPPPVTGHSLAALAVRDDLARRHDVNVIDIGKGSQHDGRVSWRRLREVGRILSQIRRGQREADAIYLTTSESVAGNLKDLVIYALCATRLDRLIIHVHGGSLGRRLLDRFRLLRAANALAFRRLAGVIITGNSHRPTFDGILEDERIHVVHNFAHDALFAEPAAIRSKFACTSPLHVVYVSAMSEMKGYDVLADGYLALPPAVQAQIVVDFAGEFETAEGRSRFEAKIAATPGLRFHGLVQGDAKVRLFAGAHVFCLPTAFFEGQPISILEAYAAGCVVLATPQRGILDIFTPGVHGREIQPRSPESVRDALLALLETRESLLPIALANRQGAEQFRITRFNSAVRAIVESASSPSHAASPAPATHCSAPPS